MSAPYINFSLVEFDWNSVDSVLMPNKWIVHCQRCTLILLAAKKNVVEDVSAASLALHAQNFASTTEKNFMPEFTNRLSLTLHKIWFSLSQIFAYMDRI